MKKLLMLAIAALLTVNFATAQQSQQQQRPQQQREQMTVEKRAEMLKKQLGLSDEQCAEYVKFEKERKEVKRGDREAMKKAMEEQTAFMKKLLTEEQYKKYQEMQKKQKQRQQGGQQRGDQRPQRQR